MADPFGTLAPGNGLFGLTSPADQERNQLAELLRIYGRQNAMADLNNRVMRYRRWGGDPDAIRDAMDKAGVGGVDMLPSRPGPDPSYLGPPTIQPGSTHWWLDQAMSLMPIVGGARDMAQTLHDAEALPPSPSFGQLAPVIGSGILAAAGMVPGGKAAGKAGHLAMDAASLARRADAMGFHRGMPLLVGTAREGERIMPRPAIRLKDGRIIEGPNHPAAMESYMRETGKSMDDAYGDLAPIGEGFVTSDGRFVGRHEAADLYWQNKDAKGVHEGLTSAYVKPAAAPAGRRPNYRIATTEPGLPGIEGTWGRLDLLPQGGASRTQTTPLPEGIVQVWHRASKPGRIPDAAGLSDQELKATLQEAWKGGHDAVLIENYIRPGGTAPERIVVVRDRAQLRLPGARFDPGKILSRDLTAALGFPVLGIGAYATGRSGNDDPL